MTDFGLFGLLGRRDRDKDIGAVIREATEHARLGEQVGFSTAWFAEHHFSNYSLTVSPLMMVAHLAAVTKTIRLGTSVVLGCL
ncbi:MAG: LLM class flavin-dependent oxidoreductase, partial [Alphaproteobacteria bacterium]|nr:LLM class flavin-dependent oxidoreductase [Alphaproteobacteria bacterium]